MADFFPLISRAIKGLPENATREQRDVIYDKARGALERQLRSAEPSLSELAIISELAALETAIADVEQDLLPKSTELPEIETSVITDEELFSVSKSEPGLTKTASDTLKEIQHEVELEAPLSDNLDVKSVSRPRVPLADSVRAPRKKNNTGIVLAAGLPIVLGVMGVVGIFAFNNKQKPEDFKVSTKIGESDISKPLASNDTVVPDTDKPQAPLPIAVRASFYEENPTNSQQRIEHRGAIIWRMESDASDQSVASQRIRGNMEFPDFNMNAEIVVRRNLDASFPASHTINLRFLPTAAGVRAIKSILVPEFRTDLSEKGPLLQAVKAPDVDNVFLIALVNTEPFQTTNIELLKKSGWLIFEVRFADGKRGELVFEKGVGGNRVFSEAFASWGQ